MHLCGISKYKKYPAAHFAVKKFNCKQCPNSRYKSQHERQHKRQEKHEKN